MEVNSENIQKWRDSFPERGVKNERHIRENDVWPAGGLGALEAVRRQGLAVWFERNPGYNKPLVLDFYKNMIVEIPVNGSFMSPEARITSTIGRAPVVLDVNEIARGLRYTRPVTGFNFPAGPDNEIPEQEVQIELYMATMQRVNQAMLLQLRQQQEANQLQQAIALQQIVAQKQQQDAMKAGSQDAADYNSNYQTNIAPINIGAAQALSY